MFHLGRVSCVWFGASGEESVTKTVFQAAWPCQGMNVVVPAHPSMAMDEKPSKPQGSKPKPAIERPRFGGNLARSFEPRPLPDPLQSAPRSSRRPRDRERRSRSRRSRSSRSRWRLRLLWGLESFRTKDLWHLGVFCLFCLAERSKKRNGRKN